jgi:DNA-binding NarL/FixJ family response regulator
MQVFLVEDSPMVRQRLEALLAEVPGIEIVGRAADAATAIRDILETRPDLVILDIQLAKGSGFDVLRELHARTPELDVIMLSNYSADPYRQIAERFGARAFFDKTKDFERVREAVAQRAAAQ